MNDHIVFSDRELRLIGMGGSFIAVQVGMVNLEDLVRAGRSGAIVRCHGKPADCLQVVQMDAGPAGCVAGWISEDDA